jgi:hypothetical protein
VVPSEDGATASIPRRSRPYCLVGLIFAARTQPRALPPVPIASTSWPRSTIPLAGMLQLCRTPDVPHRSSIDTGFQIRSVGKTSGDVLPTVQTIVTRLSLMPTVMPGHWPWLQGRLTPFAPYRRGYVESSHAIPMRKRRAALPRLTGSPPRLRSWPGSHAGSPLAALARRL